jgi:PleD family two-component response regulator
VEVQRDDERTAEEILRDADRAMYSAKRGGRRD